LFIQPTVYLEVFGLTAIEALATGTPLLLSTAGSGSEIIASSEVGVLVKNSLSLIEQAEEWQNKITDAIDLDELANAFEGALKRKWNYLAIRKYVEELFSIKAMTDKYLNFYKEVMEGEWWGDV
jgi:glycosyltransferase involved in cell wall biosynthesis